MKLNCNKKKGFTLIELLAVIVILAIIAVIATPIITGIIEDSKKASFERSAEGVVEATKFDIPEKLTETGYTYEFENGEIDLGENVKINNAKNLSGTIKYNKDGEVSYAIHNDKWCVIKNNNETTTTEYEEGKCVLETSTIASAFTYIDNISFETGDNCVSYFQTNNSMSEEDATTVCSGGEINGLTLKEAINKGYLNLEELKANNVINNVVTGEGITITDYDINIGGIDVVIPSTIDGKTVVAIGDNAFYAKALSTETSMLNKSNIQFMSNKEDREIAAVHLGNIKSVVIPSTVKSIGERAFANNQISSVTLSNGLETIGEVAFTKNQLTTITIPKSVTNIGSSAFYKGSSSNPNLTKIVNKTGNSFNWGNIINNTSGYEFIAGTVVNDVGNVEITSE